MSPDLNPILDQIKILYTSAIPLFKAVGNIVIVLLEFVIRMIREGLGKLS